mgnify:CR=1 FL=1
MAKFKHPTATEGVVYHGTEQYPVGGDGVIDCPVAVGRGAGWEELPAPSATVVKGK